MTSGRLASSQIFTTTQLLTELKVHVNLKSNHSGMYESVNE